MTTSDDQYFNIILVPDLKMVRWSWSDDDDDDIAEGDVHTWCYTWVQNLSEMAFYTAAGSDKPAIPQAWGRRNPQERRWLRVYTPSHRLIYHHRPISKDLDHGIISGSSVASGRYRRGVVDL